MIRNVDVVTPPAEEPVSLDEAKAHLRLEIDEDDALVMGLIKAARMLAEVKAKEVFVDTTFALTLDSFGEGTNGGYWRKENRYSLGTPEWFPGTSQGEIFIPRAPVKSIASILYVDAGGSTQLLSPSIYKLVPGKPSRLAPKSGQLWPNVRSEIGAVRIEFVAGMGGASDVPESVKLAMKLMIGAWYECREAVTPGSVEVLPMAVDSLLGARRWGWYA